MQICEISDLYFIGRFYRNGWGMQIDGKVGWCLFESIPWLFFPYWLISESRQSFGQLKPLQLMFTCLWMLHYIHRSLIYTLRAPAMAPTNTTVVLSAVIFNMCNAFLNGIAIAHDDFHSVNTSRVIFGVFLFFLGMVINIHSDSILFGLRNHRIHETAKSKPRVTRRSASTVVPTNSVVVGTRTYYIPVGGLYTYVSGANYLGEIVEWIGWAIAVWNSAGFAFAFFTMANLIPRALSTHKWYLKTFKEKYPENRKAVIPFIL